jgi:hypothetical protein
MAVRGAVVDWTFGLDTSDEATDEAVVVLSRVLALLLCALLLMFDDEPVERWELELTVRFLLECSTVEGGVAYMSLLILDMRFIALSLG